MILPKDSSGLFANYTNQASDYVSEINGLDHLDTSQVTDMSDMFFGDSNLTSLDLSSFDTSNVTNMSGMLCRVSGLTSLNLSNLDTSKVTNMSRMISEDSNLTHLDLSNFKTSNVTDMNNMFFDDRNLTDLNISSLDTSNVTNMSSMFSDDSNLPSVDLSKLNTSKVTDMSSMFYGDSKLTNLDVSKLDTSKVTDMNNMFGYDGSLENLDLSNFKTSKVTNMSDMFQEDMGLTSLDVSKFDTSNVTDMGGMFDGAFHLTSLNVSNFRTPKVTDMDYMFSFDMALTDLNLSKFNTSNVTDMSGMFETDRNLEKLDISNFDTSKTTQKLLMFGDDLNLWDLALGNKVDKQALSSLPDHLAKTPIPDSKPVRYTTGSGWVAVDAADGGTADNPQGKTVYDGQLSNRPAETETYVWQQKSTPVAPKPTTPSTPSTSATSSSSSSLATSSTANGNSSTGSSTPTQVSSSDSSSITSLPSYAVAKGTVVYAINRVGLYKSTKFSNTNRRTWYTKKPRIYRPMFVVTGYSRDSNGRLRYQVRDVNHTSKTDGKTGYITTSQKYVRPVYYAAKHSTVTVINPRGVVAYRKANLTKRIKNYRQGTVLHVKSIVTHNLTTRYVLTNGDYITANRKLVNMGRHQPIKTVKTKRGINRYANQDLTKRNHSITKNKILKVYGYDYSYGNSIIRRGSLRYRVAGGYITANTKYVRAYK